MNGAAVLLLLIAGGVVGGCWVKARRFGLNDCRQCLSLGHDTRDRAGCCTRCGTRLLYVAP